MKDIKDYLYLYWGCEVSVTNLEGRYNTIIDQKFINTYVDEDDGELYNDPKLILRPLSDMREDERNERWQIIIQGEKGNLYEVMRWELSKSFDLFNLIEAGLAIDKTTLSKEQQ